MKVAPATTLPAWLQVLLGIFSVFAPQYAWIRLVVEAAWQIWQILPWFHKAGALVDLRKAVKKAKANEDTAPVAEWTDRWGTMASKMGIYPG